MKHFSIFLAVALTISVTGCGGPERKAPMPTYKVSGTVTYKGKPVVDADIMFFNSDTNRTAAGRTNKEGKYRLTTFNMNDGAVEGKSQVSITKLPPAPETAPVAETESPDYVPPEIATGPVRRVQIKAEIPEKYFQFATSGLTATVTKDGDNVVNFDLKN